MNMESHQAHVDPVGAIAHRGTMSAVGYRAESRAGDEDQDRRGSRGDTGAAPEVAPGRTLGARPGADRSGDPSLSRRSRLDREGGRAGRRTASRLRVADGRNGAPDGAVRPGRL